MARSARKPLLLPLLLLALLTAVALMAGRSCTRSERVPDSAHRGGNATMTASSSVPGSNLAVLPTGQLQRTDGGRDARAPRTEPDGSRLTALTFIMERSGLKFADAVTAAGRAKAPPTSIAPHQLEFTLQDAAGKIVYGGALDHPLHRVEEYEDPSRPGEFKRLARDVDSEAFQLRFPAELNARTVTLVERVTLNGQVRRSTLGTFPIP